MEMPTPNPQVLARKERVIARLSQVLPAYAVIPISCAARA